MHSPQSAPQGEAKISGCLVFSPSWICDWRAQCFPTMTWEDRKPQTVTVSRCTDVSSLLVLWHFGWFCTCVLKFHTETWTFALHLDLSVFQAAQVSLAVLCSAILDLFKIWFLLKKLCFFILVVVSYPLSRSMWQSVDSPAANAKQAYLQHDVIIMKKPLIGSRQ